MKKTFGIILLVACIVGGILYVLFNIANDRRSDTAVVPSPPPTPDTNYFQECGLKIDDNHENGVWCESFDDDDCLFYGSVPEGKTLVIDSFIIEIASNDWVFTPVIVGEGYVISIEGPYTFGIDGKVVSDFDSAYLVSNYDVWGFLDYYLAPFHPGLEHRIESIEISTITEQYFNTTMDAYIVP